MTPVAFRAAVENYTAHTPYRWWTIELVTGHWLLVRHVEQIDLRPDGAVKMTDSHGIEHWFDPSSVVRVMAYTELPHAPDDGGIPF